MVPAQPDRHFQEWQECRLTIGRFDGLLADTRKFGFTLVTALLTANALVLPDKGIPDRVAGAGAIMALVIVLYTIDRYYRALLEAASERARYLEVQLDFRVTHRLKDVATRSNANDAIAFVYFAFTFIAFAIAAIAVLPSSQMNAKVWLVIITVAAFALLLAMRWILKTDFRPWMYLTYPTPNDEVREASSNDQVILWRGCSQTIAEGMKANMSAGGAQPDTDCPAPTDEQIGQQVIGSGQAQSAGAESFPKFTTNTALRVLRKSEVVVAVQIERRYLAMMSGVEGGWVAMPQAPIAAIETFDRVKGRAPRLKMS